MTGREQIYSEECSAQGWSGTIFHQDFNVPAQPIFARVEEGNKVVIQSLFLLVTFISFNILIEVK